MISTTNLHPQLIRIVRAMPRISSAYGIPTKITSAYRSPAKQMQLYRKYLAGQMPYVVAKPGTSLHERGLALDIVSPDPEKLALILAKVGLKWAGKRDPVHYQLASLKSPAKPYKKKKSIFKKVLSVASWIPGPVGLAAGAAGLVVKR